MSKRVLILVEGQTEERFVKDILGPNFWPRNLFLTPTLLVTKIVKDGTNFKGGVTNFTRFRNDVERLLYGSGGALVTTLLDYYGLPSDFPGMNSRPTGGTPLQRVQHVEQAIAHCFGSPPNFVPFLAIHEFEAWLFSSPDELPRVMTETYKQAQFASICGTFSTPEEINEQPHSAPSKRIAQLFPAYKKTLHGPTTVGRIGLSKIRSECTHFNDWISSLEAFSDS